MIKNKSFDYLFVKKFAQLSGDYNPIHLNESEQSKSIVHGIAIVISILENININTNLISGIEVKFKNYLYVDQIITLTYTKKNKKIIVNGIYKNLDIIDVIIYYESEFIKFTKKNFLKENPPKSKIEIFKKFNNKSFRKISLYLSIKKLENLYPRIGISPNLNLISLLLCSTRIVGMKVPGKYSIYSSIKLDFKIHKINDLSLNYKIHKFDKRWNYLNIKVHNNFVDGEINAFLRPQPVIQPSFKIIKSNIPKLDFKNKNILVIGGSGGIGEVCVKILNYYGAKVTFTYFKNKKNSLNIKKECANKLIKLIKLDIDNLDIFKLKRLFQREKFDQIYYYATPKIFNEVSRNINTIVLNNFYKFYISNLLNILNVIDENSNYKIKFLLASTEALNQNIDNLKEYILIKNFSENIFKLKIFKNIETKIYRFKRVKTDQTSTIHQIPKFNDIINETKKAINLLNK